MLGSDSGNKKKTEEVLCQEYVLQTERLIYRIRPRDQKHPALLPIGEQAQFRMNKDRMVLRTLPVRKKRNARIFRERRRRYTQRNPQNQLRTACCSPPE